MMSNGNVFYTDPDGQEVTKILSVLKLPLVLFLMGN